MSRRAKREQRFQPQQTADAQSTTDQVSLDALVQRLKAEEQSRITTDATAATADAKSARTLDSFVNFAQALGIGAGNALSTATYGFNPVTRIRTLLEWIHRGSWIGGLVVDVVADDMTREGVELEGSIDPSDIERLHKSAARLNIWSHIRDTVAWARLYGGCVAVLLIDGQKPETPLNLDTIGKGQFKGLLVLDRWMVEPSLNDLVTELGPHLGLPKFYTVTADAPALPHMKIHYSRCIRLEGIRLPYWQKVMENLWGISVYERIYDRMTAFDSATTGAAQLVYKAYIRTYKIKNLRQIAASGGDAMKGLVAQVNTMRQFQNQEGITLLDGEDEFEGHTHNAFGGLSDALVQFGQQLSGAAQIPLVRLFGQSPAGFNTGDSDIRNYYDGIKQKQEIELGDGVQLIYRVLGKSESIQIPDDFTVTFKSLWQLSDKEKSEIANTDANTILAVGEIMDRASQLKELKQSSRTTGRFTNIDDEMIKEAEGEMAPSAGGLIPEKQDDTNIIATPGLTEIGKGGQMLHDSARAAGVLFKAGDKYLFLRRTEGDYPETWALPGGKLEKGEDDKSAAIRECDEEIGITPKVVKMLNRNEGYTTFISHYDEEFHPKLNNEHDMYDWLTKEEAMKRNLHPGVKELIGKL